MCNVHFIVSNGINEKHKVVLKRMLEKAYIFNSHGWGIWNDGKSIKGLKTIKYKNKHLKGKTIIAHNRFATHGSKTLDNTHPFETKSFVLAHNGIISKVDNKDTNVTDKKTDTLLFAEFLQRNYEKYKDELKALHETIEHTTGSLSICVYFKHSKNLYYYRNQGDFHIFKTAEGIIGSTSVENILMGLGKNKHIIQITGYIAPHYDHLYKVTADKVYNICKIKSQPEPEYKTSWSSWNTKSDFPSTKDPVETRLRTLVDYDDGLWNVEHRKEYKEKGVI